MRSVRLWVGWSSLLLIGGVALAQMGGGMGPGGNHGPAPDHFPGWQGHELEHNIILPQVAVGDQVTMTLVFTNMGTPRRMGWFEDEEDYTVTGTLRFFADNGDPLPVEIEGITDSQFPLNLEASAISYMEVSAPSGSGLQKGWLLVEVNDGDQSDWGFMDGHAVARGERLMVSAYYSILNQDGELASQVAVRPATFRRGLFGNSIVTAQFKETAAGVVRTGFAIVNSGDEEASVDLRLVDGDGQEVAVNSLTLAAGAQEARFIDELFSSIPADFQGALELSTDADGVVSLGLLQTGLVTTSLPVHHYGIWRQNQ